MAAVLSAVYLLGLLVIGGCICWLMLRSDHSAAAYFFMGSHASLALWLVSQLLIIQAVNDRQLWLSYIVGNAGICFIGMFWLLFSLSYMGRTVQKRLFFGLAALSLGFFGVIITNPQHGLYYESFSTDGIKYGPMFYVGQVYIYGSMVAGIAMICVTCFKGKRTSRGQAVLLTSAAAIPLVLNLLILLDVIHTSIALTPLSFVISGSLVLLATYRYDFLNVNAVAFEDALNTIEEGVIVFNRRGRITYLGSPARSMLGIDERTQLDGLREMLGADNGDAAELVKDGKTISVKLYRCLDSRGSVLAYIVIVSDITHYYELLDRTAKLAEAEKKLVLEQERNRIAQEVHDTAGHTLTMLTSLARLSQAALDKTDTEKGRNELREYLNEAESLSRSGVTQLRCSINNLRDDSFLKSVSGAVRMLCDTVRDMETELYIQGEESSVHAPCIRAVYDTCRELITNCVRYSNADRMDIILRFEPDRLELFVFDNGKGCGEIKEGNGLRGIRERIEKLGGTVTFSSADSDGFQTTAKIPLETTE